MRQNSHDARTGIEIVIASVPPLPGQDPADLLNGSGSEFVRRWALHILPQDYTKTRRYGGYSNRHRARYLTACRELLSTAEPAPPPPENQSAVTQASHRCRLALVPFPELH
ncbi:MAG: transposase [Rhodopirellula sp.]|nr:transposase [Rhodopirellula sp.]